MKCNRMKSIRNFLLLGVCGLLVACGNMSHKAKVEDRTLATADTQATGMKDADGQSYYTVKKGDTLYRIALEKGQSYSDLVVWNKLANPHDIKVGQVRRVVPPESTTGIIVSPNVEVRPLGALGGARAGDSASGSGASFGNNKNGPRADKLPYSAVAFAELQKSELVDAGPVKIANKTADKAADKKQNSTQDSTLTEDIVWSMPVEGKVITNFENSKNKGVDFSGKLGQNVYAAAAGTVMYAGNGIRGYGNLVIIKHANNFLSAYAHNRAILVKEKQVISKGQKIAEMGNSDSDVVKLHFEIRQQGKPVDPVKFLPIQ